jgi:hypothetical protein
LVAAAAVAGAVTIVGPLDAAAHGSSALSEEVYVVRSQDDPNLPSLPPGCPYQSPSATFGAHIFSIETRASDARVTNPDAREVGTGKACALITDPTFAPGSEIDNYIEFYLPIGTVIAHGKCPVTGKNQPVEGTVIGGCAIPIVSGPAGFVAGVATSSTILNVRHVPGFNTGSYWMLRMWRKQ